MRKLLASLTLFATLGLAPIAASADELEGIIAGINDDGILMLTDGTEFLLPEEFNVEGLEPGTKVLVDYEVVEGEKIALDVAITE